MIAGTLAGCQPAAGFGLLLHRPEHARRLRGALLRVARVALVAIDRGVVIADQTVHHLRIVHVAARHARGVHKGASTASATSVIFILQLFDLEIGNVFGSPSSLSMTINKAAPALSRSVRP